MQFLLVGDDLAYSISYLYVLFLYVCATQKNITACLLSSILVTTLKHVIAWALLSKPSKRT